MLKHHLIAPAAALIALASMLGACTGGEPTAITLDTTDTVAQPGVYPCAPLAELAASGPGTFDGGDGLATLQKGPLLLNDSGCSSTVTDLETAENWTYQGAVDQIVIINAKAFGDSDPQVTLIDPNGDVVDFDDDNGGGTSARIDAWLELDGVYTLRVEMFEPGIYTINVLAGTPEPDVDIQPAAPAAP